MEGINSTDDNRFPVWLFRREGRRRKPKAGFIDREGRVVIDPDFDSVDWFFNGRACIEVNGKWGFIDETGAIAIEPRFVSRDRFSEGVAVCLADAKRRVWEIVDVQGVVRNEVECYIVAEVVEGRAWVRTREERCAFIDAEGHFVTSFDFDGIGSYRHGLAPVSIDGRWGFVDRAGVVAIQPRFENASSSGSGVFRGIVTLSGRRGVIDSSGEWILHPQFRECMPFREGLGWFAWPDGTSAFIDESGSVVAEIGANIVAAARFSEGLCPTMIQGRSFGSKGYLNRFGEWTVPPCFVTVTMFRGGRAYVDDFDGFGYIDAKGCRTWWSTDDIDTPLHLLSPWQV